MSDNNSDRKERKGNTRRRPNESLSALGKLPPQAIDMEEAVLGALMLEKDALTAVVDILSPSSFYKDAHGLIYEAILDLFNAGEPIDLLTVVNQL